MGQKHEPTQTQGEARRNVGPEPSPVYRPPGGYDDYATDDDRLPPDPDGRPQERPSVPRHRRLGDRFESRCPGTFRDFVNGDCPECGETAAALDVLMRFHRTGKEPCEGSGVPKNDLGECQHCGLTSDQIMDVHPQLSARGEIYECFGSDRPMHPTKEGCMICGLGTKVWSDNDKKLKTKGVVEAEKRGWTPKPRF